MCAAQTPDAPGGLADADGDSVASVAKPASANPHNPALNLCPIRFLTLMVR
jgi:hypothetical protein